MASTKKTAQLQIRISREAKARLSRAARRAGQDVSSYVLDAVLPSRREEFEQILAGLARADDMSYPLASLHDLLAGLGRSEFERIVGSAPPVLPSSLAANLVAAMIEHTAGSLSARVPAWTASIEPLVHPYFGSELRSLRMHLLISSPPAYRRRNIFVDAAVGDRV